MEIVKATHHTAVSQSDRIQAFRQDVVGLKLVDVIRKHITTGVPVTVDAPTYFELRREISDHFQLHPNQIVVVGSSRLGFSLKPEKRFKEIEPKDIDVAIVSESLFNQFWDIVFQKVREDRQWPTSTKENKRFVRCLFAGWIVPDELPHLPRFALAQEWVDFFNKLNRTRICGVRPVSAWLYRNWERLEAYQEIHVAECKREIERGKNERQ